MSVDVVQKDKCPHGVCQSVCHEICDSLYGVKIREAREKILLNDDSSKHQELYEAWHVLRDAYTKQL